MQFHNTKRLSLWAAFGSLFLVSACGPAAATDGGIRMDAGADAAVLLCASSGDCDDGSFCNGTERCEPGAAAAGADGCISGTPPCTDGCSEDEDRCVSCAVPDADGDGHDSIACGGDDCDDTNNAINPGVEENCDAVDDDCDSSTLAGSSDGDGDGDGFIAAMCCNPSGGVAVCGDDCDDSNINVNPSAGEVCDGTDNDCSGVADDDASVCPGGTCVAGVCDFDAWDRTFGGSGTDEVSAVAIDDSGAVYVAGTFEASIDFGAGRRTIDGAGMFVAKFDGSGVLVWDYVSSAMPAGAVGTQAVNDIAVSPTGADVYVVGWTSDIDFGSGDSAGALLLVLNADGSYRSDVRAGAGAGLDGAVADGSGVVVAGAFCGNADWGGGVRTAEGCSMVLARYDSAAAHEWDSIFHAGGTAVDRQLVAHSLAITESGDYVVSGWYVNGTLSLADSHPVAPGNLGWGFVASLDSTRTPQWSRTLPVTGGTFAGSRVHGLAVAPDGSVRVAGFYADGSLDAGTGETFAATEWNGFTAGWGSSGEPTWARSFGQDGGSEQANSVVVDSLGRMLVVGQFSTPTNFGGGIRVPAGSTAGFFARYRSDGVHERDVPLSAGDWVFIRDVAVGPGNMTIIVGSFSGTIDLGTGPRITTGGIDGLILRLPS